MSFTVNFWKFSKRENSTKRPDGNPVSFECVLKEPCGVINPDILINTGLLNRPDYNYCYIQEFNRYYYVSEWTFSRGLWSASLNCDVLATYRDEIGSSTLYAVRASNNYDGNIIDSLYPAKTNSTYQKITGQNPFLKNVQAGCYMVGIASANEPTYGAVGYYVFDDSNLYNFIQDLNINFVTDANGFNIADASLNLQKSLIDPFSFIKSCIWFPFDIGDMPIIVSSLGNVGILNITLENANAYRINITYPEITGNISIAMPAHPESSNRGNYLNAAYRKITAVFPPFGTLEIDGTVSCNYAYVSCIYHIDVTTGIALAEIGCSNTAGTIDHLLTRFETKLGVELQLSSVYRDLFNGSVSAARGALGVLGNALSGNVLGAVSAAGGGIADAMNSMRPVLETIGSNGSFASLAGDPALYVQFIYPVDDDPAHNGRPLCQNITPANLGGYILIQDGDVPISGTQQEASAVRGYLEGGFYYE